MPLRRWTDRVLVTGFLLALAGYSAISWANVAGDKSRLVKLTIPSGPKEKVWSALPPKFESLFTNHLPARDTLAALYAALKVTWCGVSPSPRVWIGSNGWLFYNHNCDDFFMPANDPQFPLYLEFWAHEFTARHLLLKAWGIKYLLVIAPNKQTIYPELLPPAARRSGPDSIARFLKCRRLADDICFVDLRGPLLEAKKDVPLYLATDTHWNPTGAHVGYTEIARALAAWFPGMTPKPRHEFCVVPGRIEHGDLARMVGLDGRLPEAVDYLHHGSMPRQSDEPVPLDNPPLEHVRTFVFDQDGTSLPRAVMLCDSFGEHLTTMLAPHFSRFVSVGTYSFELNLIRREKPDVVIQVMVEREFELKLTRQQLLDHQLIAP